MIFKYTARDKTGKIFSGTLEADDEAGCRSSLKHRGLYATSLKKCRASSAVKRKISNNDLAIFTEQLSVMVNAGLPIIKCLRAIAEQAANPALAELAGNMRLKLEAGMALSDALKEYPAVFSNLYVNLVKAGEAGGVLDEVLGRICEYLNKEHALKQNLIKAFSYPVIVAGVAAAVVTFLVVFIVPVFAQTYEKMGVNLPLPTLVLVGVSRLAIKFWWLLLAAVFLAPLALKPFITSSSGRLIIDQLKLNLPIFGGLNRKVVVSRFISVLGLLLGSGITVIEALVLLRSISGNYVMAQAIARIEKNVRQGARIGDSLSKEKLFPPMIVQMTAAGEESGKLQAMLLKSAAFLERDIDNSVQKMTSQLEPILTFLLALVVGFIALAIYLPMFDLIAKVSKK